MDLGVDAVSMSLAPGGDHGEYSFVCPGCSVEVSKAATPRTVALLLAAGVEPCELEDTATTAEIAFEDLSPDPFAPTITLDDVIEFHFALQDDAAIAREFALDPR